MSIIPRESYIENLLEKTTYCRVLTAAACKRRYASTFAAEAKATYASPLRQRCQTLTPCVSKIAPLKTVSPTKLTDAVNSRLLGRTNTAVATSRLVSAITM